jgi:pilus assembly protein Flp/PilA
MTRALERLLRRVIGDRKAATAIEYGLIAALIVIAMISALSTVANVTIGMWGNVNNQVSSAH